MLVLMLALVDVSFVVVIDVVIAVVDDLFRCEEDELKCNGKK